jgi:hypothetical protein
MEEAAVELARGYEHSLMHGRSRMHGCSRNQGILSQKTCGHVFTLTHLDRGMPKETKSAPVLVIDFLLEATDIGEYAPSRLWEEVPHVLRGYWGVFS